jgi:hypothetical protein
MLKIVGRIRRHEGGFMTDPPNEDPARVAPEFSSDEPMPLDAMVGGFEDIRKEAPIAEDPEVLRVAVFVHGVSGAEGMGLADDVRLLLDAFVRDPASVERERSAAAPAPDADPGEDVEIALHGLNLGPEDERVLHRLIRGLVAERRAPGGTER